MSETKLVCRNSVAPAGCESPAPANEAKRAAPQDLTIVLAFMAFSRAQAAGREPALRENTPGTAPIRDRKVRDRGGCPGLVVWVTRAYGVHGPCDDPRRSRPFSRHDRMGERSGPRHPLSYHDSAPGSGDDEIGRRQMEACADIGEEE